MILEVNMEYKFSGQLNFDDYYQFQKVALKSIFLTKKMVFIFCAIAFLFTSDLFDFRQGILLKNTTTIIAIVAFVVFLLVLLIMLNSKKVYKKAYNSNKTFTEICNYTITDDSITITSDSGSSILTKENIHKIVFDKDSIYIFRATNIANIIKMRFFGGDYDYNNLIMFIKDKYKENINKKYKRK
jgi:hypothetical protein